MSDDNAADFNYSYILGNDLDTITASEILPGSDENDFTAPWDLWALASASLPQDPFPPVASEKATARNNGTQRPVPRRKRGRTFTVCKPVFEFRNVV